MERSVWTDERLDDLARKVDAGFERVDRDIHDVRTDLRDLRALVLQLWGSTVIGFAGVIATVLLTNS
jgi:hypothetical protein